jgi:hypothetical protein
VNRREQAVPLREAAARVAAVLRTLNRRAAPCRCCGLNKAEDWDEYQLGQQLEALERRLRDLADRLANAQRERAHAG